MVAADYIILVFSSTKLSRFSKLRVRIRKGLIDKLVSKYYLITIKYSESEKSTGPSGVIPIAVIKEESNIEILLLVYSFYY
ncbi:MAG: hypothetical protein ACRD8K_11790 [Nitrososphaeraceae archaeon]